MHDSSYPVSGTETYAHIVWAVHIPHSLCICHAFLFHRSCFPRLSHFAATSMRPKHNLCRFANPFDRAVHIGCSRTTSKILACSRASTRHLLMFAFGFRTSSPAKIPKLSVRVSPVLARLMRGSVVSSNFEDLAMSSVMPSARW